MDALLIIIQLICVGYFIVIVTLFVVGVSNRKEGKKAFGNVLISIGLLMVISIVILLTIGASICGIRKY